MFMFAWTSVQAIFCTPPGGEPFRGNNTIAFKGGAFCVNANESSRKQTPITRQYILLDYKKSLGLAGRFHSHSQYSRSNGSVL